MGEEHIVGKIVITGSLKLVSPLLIGSGQDDYLSDNDKDIHVMKVMDDRGRMQCVIPGTSIAGVLRELVAEQCRLRNSGINNRQIYRELYQLFGELDIMQSSIDVNDVILENAQIVYRDGVRIDEDMGAAIDGAKYDYEAVDRGADGKLRLVITLRGIHTENPAEWQTANIRPEILNVVFYIRECLEKGIRLGAMTAKGLGQIKVEHVQAGLYDFANAKDVTNWLLQEIPDSQRAGKFLQEKSSWTDRSNYMSVDADFALKSSLIIRDYGTEVKTQDGRRVTISLKNKKEYIIPGTSIKGVLRHQAAYILDSLGQRKDFLSDLMGSSESGKRNDTTEGRVKSRFFVDEVYIAEGKKAAVQAKEITRNRIDRFTGGTIESALFAERPLWQHDDRVPTVHLRFFIKDADDKDAGLALFLLKDLWQGKIAIGGEAGVGRGTLKGLSAKITYHDKTYELDMNGRLIAGNPDALEHLAKAFVIYAKEEV
ncbi:RAMP superfamily CRISPR-associated protein [Selenomonas ruminantium]|uniref:RAMP superfamily CRISPR-associated protein n=1 Tax=Selenomonas ruminantium TaxID=971 RepID=UPI00041DFF0B|nr:RAMP superfamily CRISPR-associated protein [Selenomonas ruminantium]